MKAEYPKMIYKDGLGNLDGVYCVVKDKKEHDEKLKKWGVDKDKSPEKVEKVEEVEEDKQKSDNHSDKEAKPAKKVTKKKATKKKVVKKKS